MYTIDTLKVGAQDYYNSIFNLYASWWVDYVKPSNDEFTLSLLTNDEVLAVNQASANNKQLKEENGLIAWTADVPGTDDKYVAFFNTNDTVTSEISVTLAELGVSGNYAAKDLWSKEDKGSTKDKFAAAVDPHASLLVRFSKLE